MKETQKLLCKSKKVKILIFSMALSLFLMGCSDNSQSEEYPEIKIDGPFELPKN